MHHYYHVTFYFLSFPSPPRYASRSLPLSSLPTFLVCHSILEFQNIFEQRRISEKKKNVCTADWVYVLDFHCHIYSSVQVAQQLLLYDDAKYFRRNK